MDDFAPGSDEFTTSQTKAAFDAAVTELMAHSPVPMWIFEQSTLRFLAVNESAVSLYGWSREEFAGMTIADIRPPGEVAALREHLSDAEVDETFHDSGLWRHLTKDGRLLTMHITSYHLRLLGRHVVMVAALDQTAVDHATRRTAALYRLGQLADLSDTATFLDGVADVIGQALDSTHAALFLINDQQPGQLTMASATSPWRDQLTAEVGDAISIDEASVWSGARVRRDAFIDNEATGNQQLASDFRADDLLRAAVVPTLRGDQAAALVAVANKPGRYTADDVETARSLGDIALHLLEGKRAHDGQRAALHRYERAAWAAVEALARATEARDPYTAGHQHRVGVLASHIGNRLGLPQGEVDGLQVAGALHDLGKIAIPAEILTKPGRLSEVEMALVRTHTDIGGDILREIDFPWPVRDVVTQHHERLDGSGYPAGLSGDEICLAARIVGVADVVDAMTSMRPYRSAVGVDAAIAELMNHRGVLYQSDIVDAAVDVLHEFGGVPPHVPAAVLVS